MKVPEPEDMESATTDSRAQTPQRSPKGSAGAAVRLGGRLAAGLVVGVGAVAVVLASAVIPAPTLGAAPEAIAVTPVPTTQQLACAGSVLRLGSATGENATSTTPLGTPSTTRGATEGEATIAVLDTPDGGNKGIGAPSIVSAVGENSTSRLAGAQSQYVSLGDFRGLAASTCSRPSSDVWLVGGATTTGRTTLLTLSNGGTLASTVTLELWGDEGRIDAPGTSGIVVPARSQRVLSMAGFAPGRTAIAVHLTSHGGPIGANLQQSIVRGIDPGGVEILGPVATPATMTVIPGVVVTGSTVVETNLGRAGYDDLSTIVRAMAAGGAATTATVSIVPETPGLDGASFEMDLPADTVVDVPVEGLGDGSYTVVVTAEEPVVAAVRTSAMLDAALGGTTDVAWFIAAPALAADGFLAIAPGPTPQLHIANPGTATAKLSVHERGGATSTVTVPAGSAVVIDVEGSGIYSISGADGLFASVSYTGAGQLASYVVDNSTTPELPVKVYP
jgi:hypothetical protein